LNLLEQFLQWITYANLYDSNRLNYLGTGVRWNILGVFWLLILVAFTAKRFSGHFNNGFFPKPAHNPRSYLWMIAVFLFAFVVTFLLQMMIDDFITDPINLCFGSWKYLAPGRGEFSILKFISFKWDVYLLIGIYSIVLAITGIWRLYQFTKTSLFWLSVTVIFQVALGYYHVFYFLDLTGYARLMTFWLSYPWFRIFTGFLGISLIKKPGGSQ
jgi:hypothetical protein